MRLAVVADLHGNAVALERVIADAEASGVDRWWALGDLVLFGPRPVEVLDRLAELPQIECIAGNTDRYVLTGEQPHPHPTPAHAVGDVDLVQRYSAMAGAIGWTRGALVQANKLTALQRLHDEVRLSRPDGRVMLGVHASPGRDDGPGIDNRIGDAELTQLLDGAKADIVIGGHTHDPTDRPLPHCRALNAGSLGVPRRCGYASWLLLTAEHGPVDVELRESEFDVDEVVADLHRRGYPNADFMESVLRGTRPLG